MSQKQRQDRILIIEDEPPLAETLGQYMTASGYLYHWITDGRDALESFHRQQPDLVLLDLMLPGRNGLDICRDLRRVSDVPVIIVTARVAEIDRLLGLDVGADDYICKPFSPREVIARIGAVLRRHRQVPGDAIFQALVIDEDRGIAFLHNESLPLTPMEFRLLRLLFNTQGRLYSRDQLLDGMYDDHRIVTDRTVDSHIKNLRRKLLEGGAGADWIKSVYGVGYRLDLHESPD